MKDIIFVYDDKVYSSYITDPHLVVFDKEKVMTISDELNPTKDRAITQ